MKSVITVVMRISWTSRPRFALLGTLALLGAIAGMLGCKSKGGESRVQPTPASEPDDRAQDNARRIGVVVTGSSWRSVEVVAGDPRRDVIRLNEFLRSKGGSLLLRPEDVVQWKDNMYCRLFEFPGYSILVFPHNWTEGSFQMTFIAGQLKDYTDIAWNAEFRYDPEGHQHRNESMNLNMDEPGLKAISFLGISLGQSQDVAVGVMRRELWHLWDRVPPSERKTQQIGIREWSLSGRGPMAEGEMGILLGTTEGKYKVTVFFDRGKVALMEIAPRGYCGRHDIVPPGPVGVHYAGEKKIVAAGVFRGADVMGPGTLRNSIDAARPVATMPE